MCQVHEAVVLVYHGHEVLIDRNIAGLMRRLWDLGIMTTNCCGDNRPKGHNWGLYWPEGCTWIDFASAQDANLFLMRVIGANEKSFVAALMTLAFRTEYTMRQADQQDVFLPILIPSGTNWTITVPFGYSPSVACIKPGRIPFSVSIRFPKMLNSEGILQLLED